MNLKTAGISVRKAAALEGIRTGTWTPFFDVDKAAEGTIAIVKNNSGSKTVEITAAAANYSAQYTWSEINKR